MGSAQAVDADWYPLNPLILLYSYPPITQLMRTCVCNWYDTDIDIDILSQFRARTDTILPFSTMIVGVDGREMHEIIVPKDTTIIMSIINCNRDPALWGPDSYEWKPERWLSPLPDTIMEAPVPGVYSHL